MFKRLSEPLVFQQNPLPHYIFRGLYLPHAVSTRQGGVSRGPYSSLNLSFEVGDNPEHVRENRRRLKELLGCRVLVSSKQIHRSDIFVAEGLKEDVEVEGFDILVTQDPEVGLLIKQADCQAVILWTPDSPVLALAHIGWRGLVQGALPKVVVFLEENFGVSPLSLRAGISPSLQPCCAEFKAWPEIFPSYFGRFQTSPEHFDLPAISTAQLCEAGLKPQHIFISRKCTKCSPEFFSYRREGVSGRFGTIACLKPA